MTPSHIQQPPVFDSYAFFGQFIQNRTVRALHPAAFTRFMECRPLTCPECGVLLPLNSTPDDYLHCVSCSTYWDLHKHRPVITKTDSLPQMVLPL